MTLKALMPTTKAVFNQLFTTLTIEEPGFQDVVILYRRNIPDKPQPKNEKSPIRDEDPVSFLASRQGFLSLFT